MGLLHKGIDLSERNTIQLVFGSDAIIPTEVAEPSSRIVSIDEESNDEIWKLIEEVRDIARVKKEVMKLQNSKEIKHTCLTKKF